jgi:acetate kinase
LEDLLNILVLNPGLRKLAYAMFLGTDRGAVLSGTLVGEFTDETAVQNALAKILGDTHLTAGAGVEALAVRVAHGGELFDSPVLADDDVLRKLRDLIPTAPLHVPATIRIIEGSRKIFAGLPIVLAFETSFFVHLPERERLYGLDMQTSENLNLRRFGFHGIHHQAACAGIARRRQAGEFEEPPRVLSICLESRPEVAAVIGGHPVMVTGGATPLEGIPGQTTCGELDPNIVLTLAQRLHWGPEQIDDVLTRRSGVLALTGKPISLGAVLKSRRRYEPARKVIQYRILLACGAGIAAMGGLDAIVFSGQYAEAGRSLGAWLLGKLSRMHGLKGKELSLECFTQSRDCCVAEIAVAVALTGQSG